ncbi:uncharacterized protein LOC121382056 isoform X2 [Gigantopelta aegis]|uniref:uncharacterized protein LOC121382056 isoform X2 n=1 Tax=Gigantopelta aegis TaxID=1735272 RepID=UPI001B888C8F|nr:uncharacterized protein LOC121382056 isoform X2 [Gigantopelta aegis]
MCVRQRTCSIISVFVYATVIGLAQTVISELLDQHGKSFFVPFLNVQTDLFIEIAPSFPGLDNITVHVTDSFGLNGVNSTVSRSSVLRMEFTELFTSDNSSGVRVTASDDISVFVKQTLGDVMVLSPLNAMDKEYLLPAIASAQNYQVYVYCGAQSAHLFITGNCSITTPTRSACDQDKVYAIQSFQTLQLENHAGVMFIKGDNPFGVILIASGLFFDAFNTSVNRTEDTVMESVPPVVTLGKLHYFWVHQEISLLTFSITALDTANLTIQRDSFKQQTQIDGNVTTTFDFQHVSDIAVTSDSRILVFVTIDVDAWQAGFFLPPLEQYTVCQMTNSCMESCPSVLLLETQNESFRTRSTFNFADASDSRTISVTVDADSDYENSTIAKAQLNRSHLFFLYDGASGSVYHVGGMLRKLNGACVPSIAESRQGDAIDNDCDGRIDEEILDSLDNDDDSLIDEDVACNLAKSDSEDKSMSPIDKWLKGGYYLHEEETQRPLIAVILSLCVAIFAVFALISLYMLFELMARRRQLRNTKIRPFVS